MPAMAIMSAVFFLPRRVRRPSLGPTAPAVEPSNALSKSRSGNQNRNGNRRRPRANRNGLVVWCYSNLGVVLDWMGFD